MFSPCRWQWFSIPVISNCSSYNLQLWFCWTVGEFPCVHAERNRFFAPSLICRLEGCTVRLHPGRLIMRSSDCGSCVGQGHQQAAGDDSGLSQSSLEQLQFKSAFLCLKQLAAAKSMDKQGGDQLPAVTRPRHGRCSRKELILLHYLYIKQR